MGVCALATEAELAGARLAGALLKCRRPRSCVRPRPRLVMVRVDRIGGSGTLSIWGGPSWPGLPPRMTGQADVAATQGRLLHSGAGRGLSHAAAEVSAILCASPRRGVSPHSARHGCSGHYPLRFKACLNSADAAFGAGRRASS